MAQRRNTLPSDPEFLLELLDELPSDDSDEEFDGYASSSSDDEENDLHDFIEGTKAIINNKIL